MRAEPGRVRSCLAVCKTCERVFRCFRQRSCPHAHGYARAAWHPTRDRAPRARRTRGPGRSPVSRVAGEGVLSVRNRVPDAATEGQLRDTLGAEGPRILGVFDDDPTIQGQWLHGLRLRSARLARAAFALVRAFEAFCVTPDTRGSLRSAPAQGAARRGTTAIARCGSRGAWRPPSRRKGTKSIVTTRNTRADAGAICSARVTARPPPDAHPA